MEWPNPLKPAELSEERIIQAILDGTFPINSLLPSERDLSVQLGITRPTLRETLQRLARDGWLEIHHGRQTRVKNYWQEGNIAVLSAIARHARRLLSISSRSTGGEENCWRQHTHAWLLKMMQKV